MSSVTTPTGTPSKVAKGDWVVFDPREDKPDKPEKPNRYWTARIGREFLALDAGPVRVLLWDDQYHGLEGGGDAISCCVEDVRVVRSFGLADREGAVRALRAAAEHFGATSGIVTTDHAAGTLHDRADAIEAGEDL